MSSALGPLDVRPDFHVHDSSYSYTVTTVSAAQLSHESHG